jgi:hypothetical protein
MSDVDPTPSTPVTIGDRLGWWRGDLAARLDAQAAQLDTLATKLDDVVTAIEAIAATDTSPIVTALTNLRGSSPGNTLHEIYAMTAAIGQLLGVPPYDSTEIASVRSFLFALVQAASRNGIAPNDPASSDITSSSTIAVDGRRYVVWPSIIGVSRSSDHTELTPSTSWSGYSIYIQTSAPSARLDDITSSGASIDPFPVNSWVDLGGGDTIKFSVDSSYAVTAYMRVPDTFSVYTWSTSEVTEVSSGAGPRWYPDPDKYPVLNGQAIGINPVVFVGNWGGWSFVMAGAGAYYAYGPGNTNTFSYGTTGTLPSGTTWLVLASDTGPISIELTPP